MVVYQQFQHHTTHARFPLYYELKIGFVLWLVLPITEVSMLP